MRSQGNGRPEVCAANLLYTIRGEVPYDRIKGIDRQHIDRPGATGAPDLYADAAWLLRTYEPRIRLDDAQLAETLGKQGAYRLDASVHIGGSSA